MRATLLRTGWSLLERGSAALLGALALLASSPALAVYPSTATTAGGASAVRERAGATLSPPAYASETARNYARSVRSAPPRASANAGTRALATGRGNATLTSWLATPVVAAANNEQGYEVVDAPSPLPIGDETILQPPLPPGASYDGMPADMMFDGDCADCPEGEPALGCDALISSSQISAGFAFTFVQPYFSDNVALNVSHDVGSVETYSQQQFDYGWKSSPRIWLELVRSNGLGARLRYWEFDHPAESVSASPPTLGTSEVSTPPLANFELGASTPGSLLAASSGLEMYAVDLEGTKGTSFGPWSLTTSAGLRYGYVAQRYTARTSSALGIATGEADFFHTNHGIGPTVAIETRRALARNLTWIQSARGALLFGKGRGSLRSGEGLNLANPTFTVADTARDQLIPVAELSIGIDWRVRLCNSTDFFLQNALEGQYWGNVGNASSEDGNLGLFGFTTAFGLAF